MSPRKAVPGKTSYPGVFLEPTGRYRAHARIDGKQVCQRFDTIAEAIAWKESTRTDVRRGVHLDPEKGKTTFADFSVRARSGRLYSAQSAGSMDSYYRTQILPSLGHIRLCDFTKDLVQRWVNGLARTNGEPLASASVTTCFMFLSRVIKDAVEQGYLPRDVTRGVKLPREERMPRRALELDEVMAMAAAVHPRFAAAVLLGAGMGLRPGEVFAVTKEKVLFLRSGLHVHHNVAYSPERGVHLGPPKTPTSHTRGVPLPMPAVVGEALAAHLVRFPTTPMEVMVTSDRRRYATQNVELLFLTTIGTPVRRSAWQGVWAVAAKQIGLEPGYGFHDLRHHFASSLINAHRPPAEVQRLMRHSHLSETLDVYSHEFASAHEETDRVHAIDRLWGTSVAATLPIEGTPDA